MYNTLIINDVKTVGYNLWFGDYFTHRSTSFYHWKANSSAKDNERKLQTFI